MTPKKHFTVVFIIHFMFRKLFNKLDQTILNFLFSTLQLFPSINKIEFKDLKKKNTNYFSKIIFKNFHKSTKAGTFCEEE